MFSTSRFAPAALSSVELVVGIKRYKQTDAPYQKLVVRIRHYKQTNRQMKPFKKLVVRIKCYKETGATLRGPFGAKNVTSSTRVSTDLL